MTWNLEGLKIKGTYLGDFPVSGRVRLSRVQLGGTVAHHVDLDIPIQVYGAVRESVIVEHKDVLQVSDN
jgi:hypothetical protein